MSLDFIFMLTDNDQTVIDAHHRLQEILQGDVQHVGFKDIGLPFNELRILAESIKKAGITSYLEVVSLDEESEIRSAKAAIDLGVDYLMGGTRPEVIAPIVKNHPIKYYPFVGQVVDHPSVLIGTIEEIIENTIKISAIDGVDGLDLLAYRFSGDVPKLMMSVCEASSLPVIIAGSIDNKEKIHCVSQSGAIGFTVGSAAFANKFSTETPNLPAQLTTITSICSEL